MKAGNVFTYADYVLLAFSDPFSDLFINGIFEAITALKNNITFDIPSNCQENVQSYFTKGD